MKQRNLILSFSAEPAVKVSDDGLTFEKEIVRAGTFTKKGRGGKVVKHVITEDDTKYWPKVFSEMRADGVRVPVPVEHTADPEKNRGEIVDMVHRPNSKGVPATFARMRFRDKEAAKLAMTAGVSVYVPAEIHNGTKNKTYQRAIEHVALTDYPVINDLEPFKPLALSLKAPEEGDEDVTLRELATQFGVDPNITDEQQIMLALSQKALQLRGPGGGAPGGAPAPAAAPPRPAFGGPPRPFGMSQAGGDEDEPIALSGSLLTAVRENREMKIDRLVTARLITPAVAKDLKSDYCADDAIKFSHLDGFDDKFDKLMLTLAKNAKVIPDGTKAPPQVVALSHGSEPQKSGLVADAERRNEEPERAYA